MNAQYSPEVREQVEHLKVLEQASRVLKEILGPESQVKAKWDRVQDHGKRTLYRLTIRDLTGEVATDFAPDDLENPLHMKVRLYRLWGDLLQIRNNQQHQQVQIISSQITTG